MKLSTLSAALCAAALAGCVLTGCGAGKESSQAGGVPVSEASGSGMEKMDGLNSQEYVCAMGHGWNLGNSFDGANTDESVPDSGETEWGNPIVTRELIRSVKAKGFDSIRIPMTLFRRYEDIEDASVIDEEWLARYKEVIDWAVEEDLYVMVNIHHDS